ncbi:MAG: FAD-dependent oxidoreductase [Proteobacteria bacterium]|nr:FAD-dependent oxidoreductase [Pseudomonadota bacterium]
MHRFPAHPVRPLEVAVIGGGIAGLGCAWLLGQRHRVTLYEKATRLGGHSNTVTVEFGHRCLAVDTGFIVYNEPNYPNLTRLFAHLGVATQPSDMSFAVSIDRGRLEYGAGDYAGLFAQPKNLVRLQHWRMIADIVRFFREAPRLLAAGDDDPTLGEYLSREMYSRDFLYDHLLPMGAAIWSVPIAEMLKFPARSFVQFFVNHGMLRIDGRPQWRTVTGGSRSYVAALAERFSGTICSGREVQAVRADGDDALVYDGQGGARRFDHVVIAAHADEALAMLARPTAEEERILGAFRYQPNLAVLHRDPRLMPRRRRAWASWNYLAERDRTFSRAEDLRVSVTYWMNRLQALDPACPVFVSLNPIRVPRDALTFAAFEYRHPAFDRAALRAQAELANIQGRGGVWYCGSYCGHGFHEDALASGLAVAEALGARRPWAGPGRDEGAVVLSAGGSGVLPSRAVAAAGD